MKRPVGRIYYTDLAFKLKGKSHPIKTGMKIIILLGILYFIYRRFVKKS